MQDLPDFEFFGGHFVPPRVIFAVERHAISLALFANRTKRHVSSHEGGKSEETRGRAPTVKANERVLSHHEFRTTWIVHSSSVASDHRLSWSKPLRRLDLHGRQTGWMRREPPEKGLNPMNPKHGSPQLKHLGPLDTLTSRELPGG